MPLIEAGNKYVDRRFNRVNQDPKGEYARVVINLDNVEMVGIDIEIGLMGTYLAKISCDGSAVYFRFDRRHNSKIYVDEFKDAHKVYDKIYLTNPTSQPGKKLVLQVGNVAEIHSEISEDLMISDELSVATDAQEDTIAAPGVGKAIEVLGFSINEAWDAAMVKQVSPRLWFGTLGSEGHWVWEGLAYQTGVAGHQNVCIMGIRIRGDENQKLTLRNMDFNAGLFRVNAVIYYRIVGV